MKTKSIIVFTFLVTFSQGLPQNTPDVSVTKTTTIASNDPVVNTPATTKVWNNLNWFTYFWKLIYYKIQVQNVKKISQFNLKLLINVKTLACFICFCAAFHRNFCSRGTEISVKSSAKADETSNFLENGLHEFYNLTKLY